MSNLKEPGPVGVTAVLNTALNDGTINPQPTPLPGTTGVGPDVVAVAAGSGKTLSGSYWVTWANTNAKNSEDIEELEDDFKTKAKEFIKALEDAGATVAISTTKRSDKRAYLFHWSWKISLDKAKASDATAMAGVEIEWDHKDDAKSKAGAKEMVDGFGLAVPPKSTEAPSLTSNHIAGKAIDMDITWSGKLKVKKKDGTEVEVDYNADVNANTDLHKVGGSYSVKKLTTDAPHWSHDGH